MNGKHLLIVIIAISLMINIFCVIMLDVSIFGWYLMAYDFTVVVLVGGVLEFSKYYRDYLRDEILRKIEFEGNNTRMDYCNHCKTFTYQSMTYDKNNKLYYECHECDNDAQGYITKSKV